MFSMDVSTPSLTPERRWRHPGGSTPRKGYVLPGMVDADVHSLSHPGEGISASTRSAAAGGVTTIVEMPFDLTGPINSTDRFSVKRELAESEAFVDGALMGTLAPEGGWRSAEALAEAGRSGSRSRSLTPTRTAFCASRMPNCANVMAATAGAERTVHAENNEIVQAMLGAERELNPFDPKAQVRSRQPVSETLGVLTALEVAHEQNARLHLCHLSFAPLGGPGPVVQEPGGWMSPSRRAPTI